MYAPILTTVRINSKSLHDNTLLIYYPGFLVGQHATFQNHSLTFYYASQTVAKNVGTVLVRFLRLPSQLASDSIFGMPLDQIRTFAEAYKYVGKTVSVTDLWSQEQFSGGNLNTPFYSDQMTEAGFALEPLSPSDLGIFYQSLTDAHVHRLVRTKDRVFRF